MRMVIRMAERRMFAKTIIDSDAFLDMSLSTQALYFHLSMRADDDGFINNPKKIQRMIGAAEDDMKILTAKKFIIPFESGVCVIKHWRIHNYIRNDRYTETVYKDEKSQLTLKDNKAYTLGSNYGIPCVNHRVYQLDTQDRLGKDRLGKDRLDNTISKDIVSSTKVQLEEIITVWNELGLQKIISIKSGTNRYKLLHARIKEYGYEKVIEGIRKINESSFLKGQNNKSWTISFDWFIKPNNFIKVIEGNYDNKDKSKLVNNQVGKKLTFSNYSQTDYDYDDLEKKLLGWNE